MDIQIEIIKPGLLTSVQDLGRFGHRNNAIPQCGVLDGLAYYQANLLVDNPDGTPCLECNFIAPEIKFHNNAIISLTGADMNWKINGEAVPLNKSLFIKSNNILSGSSAAAGVRSYIAIKGNWQIEKVKGSYSTDLNNGFGGYQGRALKNGDIIALEWDLKFDTQMTEIGLSGLEKYENIKEIKFTPGPEWEALNETEQRTFLEASYSISPDSNRMGAKLLGPKLESIKFQNLNSNIVFPGVIQWPPGGTPIVLLNDCQTTGGYPRVGIIAKEELWKFVQIRNGQQFSLINKALV